MRLVSARSAYSATAALLKGRNSVLPQRFRMATKRHKRHGKRTSNAGQPDLFVHSVLSRGNPGQVAGYARDALKKKVSNPSLQAIV
jgi:hypothetical protein